MFREPYIELQRILQEKAYEGGLAFQDVAKTMAVVVLWLLPFYRDAEIRDIFDKSMGAAKVAYSEAFPGGGWPPAEVWRPAFDAGDPLAAPPSLTLTPEMLEASIAAWTRGMDQDLGIISRASGVEEAGQRKDTK